MLLTLELNSIGGHRNILIPPFTSDSMEKGLEINFTVTEKEDLWNCHTLRGWRAGVFFAAGEDVKWILIFLWKGDVVKNELRSVGCPHAQLAMELVLGKTREIWEGTSEIEKLVISRNILKEYAEAA